MKTRRKFLTGLIAFLTLIIAAGAFPSFGFIGGDTGASSPVAYAAGATDRPAIGAFVISSASAPYTITSDSKGYTVISYSKKTSWNAADTAVSGYTSTYTRFCVTAMFAGTTQFGIDVKMPDGKSKTIRSGSDAPSKSSTRNADGSYTFDIAIPSDVRTKGITTMLFYFDPTASVSGTRSATIMDIGFKKEGELAYDGTLPPPMIVHSVSLDKAGTHAFPAVVEGYSAQNPAGVGISNTGNVPTGSLNLALSGTNASSFTLSPAATVATIAVNGKGTFTVVPKTGLAQGTYTATVTVSNANVKAQTFVVSFTVKPRPNDYYVAKNGSNSTGDGSAEKPWATIQHGINQLRAGNTLTINEGVYNEKLTVNASGEAGKYITIKGAAGKRVVLDGTGVSGNIMVSLSNKSYVRIENLEICNNLSKTDSSNGFNVSATSGSTGIQIINNKIYKMDGETSKSQKNMSGHGIAVYGYGKTESSAVKDLLIQGNEVSDCKLGWSEAVVVNGNVTDWKIIGNYIHDNDNIGIDAIGGEAVSAEAKFDRARNGLISGNVVVNNHGKSNAAFSGNGGVDGIYVDGGKDIVIENNYASGSLYGIEVGSENGTKKSVDYRPTGIIVRNNVSLLNDEAGILLGGTKGSYDVLVENNTVYQKTNSGIEINANSKPNTLKNNIVIAAANVSYVYMAKSATTPVYSNNIYNGGSASRPTGDTNGTVVTALPVVNLTNGIVTPNANIAAGAKLTTTTTPFLGKVIK